MTPKISLLTSPRWIDYELLDSGDGQKLERFGPYTFARPEVQALWKPALPAEKWQAAHAFFEPSGEESGGACNYRPFVAQGPAAGRLVKPDEEAAYRMGIFGMDASDE